jgi:dolichol kinase
MTPAKLLSVVTGIKSRIARVSVIVRYYFLHSIIVLILLLILILLLYNNNNNIVNIIYLVYITQLLCWTAESTNRNCKP